MQPNQGVGNMQDNASPMQPMQSAGMPMNNIMAQGASEKKKGGKGMIIGMVVLAILAVGGIGFGVYMMLSGNSQTAELNDQISALKKQNSELMDKASETTSDTTINVDVNTGEAVNTADYIYVGEWGLKIKMPEELTSVSYLFSHDTGYDKFYVSGAKKGGQYYPDFADITKVEHDTVYGLGTILRYPKGQEGVGLSLDLVFSSDNYDFYYTHPQDTHSSDAKEQEWELESSQLIQTMLTNAGNYSKI